MADQALDTVGSVRIAAVLKDFVDRRTLTLLMGGLVLPNLAFLVSSYWLAVPGRTGIILFYMAIALLCGRAPRIVIASLFLVALVLDIALVIQHLFFLDPLTAALSLGQAARLDILASPAYTAGLIGLVTVAAVNIAFLYRHAATMRRGSRLALLCAGLGMLGADAVLNHSLHYDLGPLTASSRPFESAVEASGFDRVSRQPARDHHVLLVLVESLGVLKDPAHRRILLSPFADETLRGRYRVTTGTSTFFGSTTHGEMRELCHTRESYRSLLGDMDPVCLPDDMAARGYTTISLHGFTGHFFDRTGWYPKLGFGRSVFRESYRRPFARRCGGPFVGPCDVDIAERIGEQMAAAREPRFYYWLTLNSHVPVRRGEATPRHACATGGPFADAEVCSMVEIWEDLFTAIRRIALDNPGTEILLVGDHAPPLWRRAARGLFEPDRVQWIRLAPLAPPIATAD